MYYATNDAYSEWLAADSDYLREKIEAGMRQEEMLMHETAKRKEKYDRRKRAERERGCEDLPF